METRRTFGKQLLFSRTTTTLVLMTFILVSQIAAEPGTGSGYDEDQGRENFPHDPSAISNVRRDVTTSVQGAYTQTPGVGVHKINQHAKTWHDARKICQEDGGDLAIINSRAEAVVVGALLDKSHPHSDSEDSNYVLIGFNDIHHDGRQVTVDGRTLKEAGYEAWAVGEPNNGGNRDEDCGSMGNDGRFNDIYCSNKYAFVCELPFFLDHEDIQDGRVDSHGTRSTVVNGAQSSRVIEGVTILSMSLLYLLMAKTYF